jgi:hypothetical protein
MNTSITLEYVDASYLIELSETFNTIDISGVYQITGTVNQLKVMVERDNFIGISPTDIFGELSQSVVIIGPKDDEEIETLSSHGFNIVI